MNQLKASGAIYESVFSIFVDINNNKSAMTFGGYDLAKYSQPNSTIDFHDAIWDPDWKYYWTLTLQEMTVSDESNSTIGKGFSVGKNQHIIVDSGTSFILMPRDALLNYTAYIESHMGISCDTSG